MSHNDSQDYPVDYEDDYFSEMELENVEDQSSQQLDQEQDHQTSDWRDLANIAIADSHLPTPAPISSTTFSLDTRFRDLGRELRARMITASSSKERTHRQSANQSAEAFAAAGGIVVAPSPTRLQPPSRRGHKLGGNSKPRKPKNSDSTLQPVAYPQSSLLDQGSNKETKAQQMHRLECNIVRLEAFINRRTEEIQTSTASAITSLREQMTHDIQVEMSRSEERSALNLAPHLQELKSLIHQELKVLEGQLKTLISSSIPLEAMNELLLTMETLLNHSPSSSASTTTSPLVLPSSPPASLINRITDSPLPRSAVKRQEPLAEDGEHSRKRLRSDPHFAHSATAILPSNAPALPAMVNPHIFDMYRQWSLALSSARGVTLPNVGFIERLGPRNIRLCFSPFGLEAFLSTWTAHHMEVPTLAHIVVFRDSAE
ncbi:hypothetical protein EV359DRAFT_65053 [Lentinula novae-zelandiae]|nr:hypothetical protein EV359DRAFT_65053 [Lentinula novae-zelandiae]